MKTTLPLSESMETTLDPRDHEDLLESAAAGGALCAAHCPAVSVRQ